MFRKLFLNVLRFNNQRRAIICSSFQGYKTRGAKSLDFYKFGPLYALSLWGAKKSEKSEPSMTTKELLITKADTLFDQGYFKEIYDLLIGFKEKGDVEILWRLSRALYYMSKDANNVEAKKMIFEAFDIISTALKIQENHWAVQKWMAIILDSKSSFEGIRSRLNELYTVKQHMIRASELNPGDATVLYMLGTWCFEISELTWYQRKIASAIFGKAPDSSYEEALSFYDKAESVDPNFYSKNLLMLGKTYLKLHKKEEARKYLKMASEFTAKNDEDQQTKQEALKFLNSI